MTEESKEEYQVCYKHPDRKTYLRCNKCGRPICMSVQDGRALWHFCRMLNVPIFWMGFRSGG